MRVLVVSGTSAGHVFPALSFLDKLKDSYKDIDTLLILPRNSLERKIAIPNGYNIRYVSTVQVKAKLDLRNLIALLKFFQGYLESLVLILEFRPDVVVGFGTLVSVPIVLLAWIFRIRTLIHEQNVIPGRANRFLAKFTDRVAVSFSDTTDYFKVPRERITLTGNPVRRELKRIAKSDALDLFGLSSDKFTITILVMGGSMGSHRINTAFLNAISMISDRSKLQVIHLTGLKDYAWVDSSYRNLNIKAKVFSFLKDMDYAYSACDLVVCRAGATTISEIIFFASPAIIVPYPFAYGHQLNNAKFLEAKGTAVIIEDDKLDTPLLRETIEGFINNYYKLKKMRDNYNDITPLLAGDLLVREITALNR